MRLRRARRAGLCGLVALAAAALAPDVSRARGASGPRCPGKGRLILADGVAAVFMGETADEELEIVGCSHKRPHVQPLGLPLFYSAPGGAGIQGLKLAGTMVAYNRYSFSAPPEPEPVTSESYVVVKDLASGRTVHRVPTGDSTRPGRVGLEETSSIVVRADGSAAWIVRSIQGACENPEVHCYEVHVVDSHGARTLAAGGDIAPHSLALAGGTVYWTRGGRPASAPI